MDAEGWYKDPYHRHADRWFSDGRPTRLVRDDDIEGDDPPPDLPFSGPLIDADMANAANGSDLKRADDPSADGTYNAREARIAALDKAADSGLGWS